MAEWDLICQYLLNAEECEDIHKIMWPSEGWGYISGKPFGRVKITMDTKLSDVKHYVAQIKKYRREL